MMNEKYYIEEKNNDLVIKMDKNTKKVYNKQRLQYGEQNALNTLNNIQNIFLECEKVIMNSKNRNVLLLGKVQSGKTSNLELFTSMAFDNDYKLVIVYGGYDKKLLKQTSDRFRKTFDINLESEQLEEDVPELFSTDDQEIDTIDESVLKMILKLKKPIIIVSMKRPPALKKVNQILRLFNEYNLKSFIIDDEGDQASLNTEFRSENKSPTYQEIIKMKEVLKNPLYLSVTATPQANVLLGEYSELKPCKIFTIEPGEGYTGAEYFHLDDDHVVNIDNEDLKKINNNTIENIPESMYRSIDYFIIASSLMKKNGNEYTDMVIHTHRLNNKHSEIYSSINNYLCSLKENIGRVGFKKQLEKIKEVYSPIYFSQKIIDEYPFDNLNSDIVDSIEKTHLILQNSQGSITQGNEKYKFHKIYIGGDLLQRGLTFNNLIVTYFTRWARNGGNMDTTMQRARWFGYRSKYLDYCKIFTTKKIQDEYIALTESEKDLWEQCYAIKSGNLSIEDIIIDASSSSLSPTRKNVADYTKVKIGNRWTNQRQGFFDKSINLTNKKIVDKICKGKIYINSTVGRTNLSNEPTCSYAEISKEEALDLVNNTSMIFDYEPFNKSLLAKLFGNTDRKIIIEKMVMDDNDIRVRTFDKGTGKISSALQQGPDTADISLKKYKGDSYVIADKDAIVIQLHRIRPRYKKDLPGLEDYDQYMFSIHTPDTREGFVKQ